MKFVFSDKKPSFVAVEQAEEQEKGKINYAWKRYVTPYDSNDVELKFEGSERDEKLYFIKTQVYRNNQIVLSRHNNFRSLKWETSFFP